jgi:hypothetical protein
MLKEMLWTEVMVLMMKKRTHIILVIKMVTVMLLGPVLVQINVAGKGNVCGS